MDSFPHPSGAQAIRPAQMGSAGLPQNFGPPMPVQFRPVDLAQQSPQFLPSSSQQFQPAQGTPFSFAGMPPPPPPHFAPPLQQVFQRSSHPGQSPVSSQAIPAPYIQPCISTGLMQSQQNSQFQSNHMVNFCGGGMPLSSSYTFSTSYEQQLNTANAPSQYQSISQTHVPLPPAAGQPWAASGHPVSDSQHPAQNSAGPPLTNSVQAAQQSSTGAAVASVTNVPPPVPAQQSSDWQEHTSSDGKRYYYNKKTKQSSWEKPLDLMTPIERADASTAWKEFTSPDGRKYYYNKLTKQSKWTIPEELKIAREQAERAEIQSAQSETVASPLAAVAVTHSSPQIPSAATATSNFTSLATSAVGSSPFSVSLVVNSVNPLSMVASGSPSIANMPPMGIPSNSLIGTTNATIMLNVTTPITSLPLSSSASSVVIEDATDATAPTTTTTTTKHTETTNEHSSVSIVEDVPDGKAEEDPEEAKNGATVAEKVDLIPLEDKPIVEEQSVYANKQEARNVFKALLESTNVESDWTWEQAMRVIINDKRYCALKSLGEKKQVFNEFLGDRKKQEIEERRLKQKKVRDDFTKMLEESRELTSSTRWRKAEVMFEGDERFNAVERAKDREDLFESYIAELRKKERAKAAEEHKRNIMEYRAFLESCDFIKASSQWRKVQDRLETDERCSRLDKFERLKVFQDYVNDLEKEEEEQQKIQKEQLRKAERKNRDDFRKLMEEHVAAGILTAKTDWRDYYMEVKDFPSYLAVSSNTSGATPKELFGDVTDELEKQYREDKARVKDALKMGKISLILSSTFESFKEDILEEDSLRMISEINLKLLFRELLEKLRDKEEKEAKRRRRLADNFSTLLHSAKEISASSTWEECKLLLADCQQYSSGEESSMKEIFEKYVVRLQEKEVEEHRREEGKAKKERGREEKDREGRKERKEKEKDHEKEKGKHRSRKDETESENADVIESSSVDDKKRGKDRDRKHRKHRRSVPGEAVKDEKGKSRKSHRHSSDRKKSRKRASESDSENRHRKQKKERHGSRRDGSYDALEDGELGDDGEVC